MVNHTQSLKKKLKGSFQLPFKDNEINFHLEYSYIYMKITDILPTGKLYKYTYFTFTSLSMYPGNKRKRKRENNFLRREECQRIIGIASRTFLPQLSSHLSIMPAL